MAYSPLDSDDDRYGAELHAVSKPASVPNEVTLTSETHGLGEAKRKSYIDYVDLLAVSVAIIAFIVVVISIGPGSKVAWHLQYNGQIIVFGFLLSGENQQERQTDSGEFAIDAPPNVGALSGVGLKYVVNASIPFIAATGNDSIQPDYEALPQAYGFNTLFLSNISIAVLDIPAFLRVIAIQQSLSGDDQVQLEATFNATVAYYNHSVDANRNRDEFWRNFNTSDTQIQPLHDGYDVGYMANELATYDNSWCFVGLIPSNTSNTTASMMDESFENIATPPRLLHRKHSSFPGSCYSDGQFGRPDGEPFPPQDLLTNKELTPGHFFMPVMGEYLDSFKSSSVWDNDPAVRPHSPWRVPVFTATVAYVHWARMVALRGVSDLYSPGQKLYVIHSVMHSKASLYIVLALQPILCLVLFLAGLLVHDLPIDRSFGMIAIMAGIDRRSLDNLNGASLSGRLKKSVRLDMRWNESTRETTLASPNLVDINGVPRTPTA
ncbi:MAG: hypothetical protein Q9159_001107 [Coniocarpon cinnabarinum]